MHYLYNLPGDLKFEVFMVLATKIKVLWHAEPCNLGDICQHSEEPAAFIFKVDP
jgi:hypothetical protein